jgi:hypothetical protein
LISRIPIKILRPILALDFNDQKRTKMMPIARDTVFIGVEKLFQNTIMFGTQIAVQPSTTMLGVKLA